MHFASLCFDVSDASTEISRSARPLRPCGLRSARCVTAATLCCLPARAAIGVRASRLVCCGGNAHLADGNDLTIGLLDTAQAFHEVPKAAARNDLVLREQVHAVNLALRVVLRVLVIRDVPSDNLVLRLARGQIRRLLPHCESNCRRRVGTRESERGSASVLRRSSACGLTAEGSQALHAARIEAPARGSTNRSRGRQCRRQAGGAPDARAAQVQNATEAKHVPLAKGDCGRTRGPRPRASL